MFPKQIDLSLVTKNIDEAQAEQIWKAVQKERATRKSFPLISVKKFIYDYYFRNVQKVKSSFVKCDGMTVEYIDIFNNLLKTKI